MSPEMLTLLLENRISFLSEQRMLAVARGDVEAVNLLDQDMVSTLESLGLLAG